ncbi:MAG: PQQ-binding-like beta-propeller repeat protein [Acidobacteriota bacterium]
MRRSLWPSLALPLFALSCLSLTIPAASADWPQYRGPQRAGASLASGVLPTEGFELEVAWRRPIGAAYSEVPVVEGRALVMFADGEHDVLSALDADSGEELWRYQIAETYEGHTGSDGGPLSTPAVADGTVYGLGPHGDMFALDLESGESHWQRRLSGAESGQPYYGFTTSPLVVDDLLVVQVGGGNGHSVTAFDRDTGSTRWRTGDDSVEYESPIVATLAGTRQLIAADENFVRGLKPATGEELWRFEHGLGGVLGTPTLLDATGLLLSGNNEAVALDVSAAAKTAATEAGSTLRASERFRTNELKRSMALPVVHEGYVYGMSRKFLTCLNARNGGLMWRSRPPGGNVLALVDGHLALISGDGELVVAKASPTDYQEVARIAALDTGSYSAPTFASNRFFLRDVTSLVAVRAVARSEVKQTTQSDEGRFLGPFGAELARIAQLPVDERQAQVDLLFEGRAGGPIVEADGDVGFAHLVFRGDARDVGVSGNLPGFTWETDEALTPIEGTDLFFRSFQVDPMGIWQYQLSFDFGEKGADPGNPRTIKIRNAEWSVLSLPQAPARPHLDPPPPDLPRGRSETFQLASQHMESEREITVYLPPGYDASTHTRYPLLIHTWENLRRLTHFEQAVDQGIASDAITPLVVAFVPRLSGREHGAQADAYVAMLTRELLPELERRYRLLPDRQQRALLGNVSSAGVALYAGRVAGDTFSRVAAQSFTAPRLEAVFAARDASHLEVTLERRSDDSERSHDATRRIAEVLRDGGARLEIVRVAGGAGPAGWRTTLDDLLIALFGRER